MGHQDMEKQLRKIRRYLKLIEESRFGTEQKIQNIGIYYCDYKTSNFLPAPEQFSPYTEGDLWGKACDSHAWFHFAFDVSAEMFRKPLQLLIKSDKEGWDADNPQFIIYINGEIRQGLDINHTYVYLDKEGHYDIYVYGYTGPSLSETRFYAKLRNVNTIADKLYYDILVPLEMLNYLDVHSQEYAMIIYYLDKCVSLLELFQLESQEFFNSLQKAEEFIDKEFYGKYCNSERGENEPITMGIGHTHIDCAWLWTLKQTREKVQRSFGTVLELMDRYPEYKFMSSQALLYKNLKEEAPELYKKVKERVAEGRWEVEGSMWVEADCNLSSGESLIRQILYGKRFFKEEFGVDNRVVWLPDVFGYSAAMPQILKKSGVDWFVTSKISWNDTNTMPFDTFQWEGIDGTSVNTYFLTAQDKTKEAMPSRYTTYVGSTNSPMVAGTHYRYKNKQLNNETILTFGHGDGGGGPTMDMLEMGRRMAKGIPGAPVFKIDFAGEFLKRLERKIENNSLLPKWRGELYLEYHRGTYTSVSKNKRNNRKAEFLYLDAELLANVDKAVNQTEFDKTDMHNGWEMILTNQFHDIIPGSSIKEVYDQCDIDYQKVFEIGQGVIENAKKNIAAKLDKRKGYVVFNPHSFNGKGSVIIENKTSIVENVSSKGYALIDKFISTNAICVEDNRVETKHFIVLFDEKMQMISLYDKENQREVLKQGRVGNEIRLYPDYPDVYDAWEWQEFSLDKYSVLTSLESVEVIDDGARKGIKIVRPYMHSKITQTMWFWDDFAKIDFDTVADWHEQHIMVKAVFPVDINSDKASYEIQFGTVERPTHKNTSWDATKFEVCAHKYVDLSEGNYGVSLINDCKYGHDIHDGEIILSLFRSPTYPYKEADQGEIPFMYSICPHKGRLHESETAKLAYYLNYPMTAIKAAGNKSEITESFSAVTIDVTNVICETVKEAEDGKDTILRLYEFKNCKTSLRLKTDFPFKKAFLCDLMENEICELQVDKGEILANIGCYEILTVKLK